ncbi:MAG: hypothetical protein MJ124_00120 [Lachnospiraceae bacterium]|nr:hypothetical protein [Lachnospiraceae bacterium]
MSFGASIKEFFRKKLVGLKRKPEILPLLAIIISCMIYTFKLSNYSNASIYATDFWVAILVFTTTLFSILSIFTYLNSHTRKGTNYVMLVLCVIILVFLFVSDFLSFRSIAGRIDAIKAAGAEDRPALNQAIIDLRNHMISLGITIAFVVLKPVYGKLLNKINTSVKDNEFDDDDDDEEVIAEDE